MRVSRPTKRRRNHTTSHKMLRLTTTTMSVVIGGMLTVYNSYTSSVVAVVGGVSAFTPPQRLRRIRTIHHPKDTPFFAVEQMLPPLAPIRPTTRPSQLPLHYSHAGPSNSTTTISSLTIPYSSSTSMNYDDEEEESGGDPLPVLYTNDPKMLNRWLVEHVPMEPCAIGFDTEVGFLCCYYVLSAGGLFGKRTETSNDDKD